MPPNRIRFYYRRCAVCLCALPLAASSLLAAQATPLKPVSRTLESEYAGPELERQRSLKHSLVALDMPSKRAAQWRSFESKDRRFSVQFPGRPLRTEQKTRTDLGYIVSVRFTVNYSEHVTYDLMFNDFPKGKMASADPEKLLDAARDGLLFKTGGRIRAEKRILHSVARARDLEIVGRNGTHYEVRLFLTRDRLYQLLVTSQHDAASDARRFFESFRLSPGNQT